MKWRKVKENKINRVISHKRISQYRWSVWIWFDLDAKWNFDFKSSLSDVKVSRGDWVSQLIEWFEDGMNQQTNDVGTRFECKLSKMILEWDEAAFCISSSESSDSITKTGMSYLLRKIPSSLKNRSCNSWNLLKFSWWTRDKERKITGHSWITRDETNTYQS